MDFLEKNERKIFFAVLTCFTLIQLLLVLFIDAVPNSDSAGYLKTAEDAIEAGKLYPLESHFYNRWIAAPGWINILSFFVWITGTYKSVYFFNIILNLTIVSEIYYLTRSLAGIKAAFISLFLFTILLSNYGIVLNLLTELIFTAFLLSALIAYLKDKLWMVFFSGVLIGLANSVRQFAPVIILVFFVSHIIAKSSLKKMIPWTVSIVFTIIVIGSISYLNSGNFIYSSISTGGNMIAGANPLADGSYDGVAVRKGGIGYIPNEGELTVNEKDAIWKERAIKWIVENPVDWLLLVPRKLFYLYGCEVSLLYHFRTEPRPGSFVNDFKGVVQHFPDLSTFEWLLVFNNLVYLTILALSLLSIYYVFRNSYKPGYIALLYIFVQTGVTVLAVGADRYHYPMMPTMIFLAAYTLISFKREDVGKNNF